MAKLEQLVHGWDAVWVQIGDAPRSRVEWYDKHKRCLKVLTDISVPRMPIDEAGNMSYTAAWTLRTVFLGLMETKGIPQLQPGGIQLGKFCTMNPDATNSMHRVHKAHDRKFKSVHDFMKAAGRKRRPELLSMDLCFAQDTALDRVELGEVDIDIFRAAKHRLTKKLKMTPHIAVIIKEALDK